MAASFMQNLDRLARINQNPEFKAFISDKDNKAFLDAMGKVVNEEFSTDQNSPKFDPEVDAAREKFTDQLIDDKSGKFVNELGKVIRQHPEAGENLTKFVREHRDIARGVILNAGQNPDAILDIAEKGRLASDPVPATPAQPVVDSAPLTQQAQKTGDFGTRFADRTGIDAPATPDSQQQSVTTDAPATGTPSPATPSGRQKVGPLPAAAGAGGIDMSNLGAGLQEMFSKLATFLQALPQIIDAISKMFKEGFSGLKGGTLFAAGNGGPDGPGSQLGKALGVDNQNVVYQYGNREPGVGGMVAFDPAQPGVYRDQQARMPTDPNFDHSLRPGMNLRPDEAVS